MQLIIISPLVLLLHCVLHGAYSEFQFDGFSIDMTRSMVAMCDVSFTPRLLSHSLASKAELIRSWAFVSEIVYCDLSVYMMIGLTLESYGLDRTQLSGLDFWLSPV